MVKWLIVGSAFLLLVLAVALFFKSPKFRTFVFLTALAMVLGMLFGPPRYVVYENYTTTLAGDESNTRYYFAWRLNYLAPASPKMAKFGFYNPELNEFRRASLEAQQRVNIPFVAPTRPAWQMSLWWWIFPVTYLVFYLFNKYGLFNKLKPIISFRWLNIGALLYFPQRNKKCQKLLDEARRHNTLWAYDDALNHFNSYRWKPTKFIEQAEIDAARITQRYEDRAAALSKLYRQAAESLQQREPNEHRKIQKLKGTATLMSMLKQLVHSRGLNHTPAIDLSIQVLPGWFMAKANGELVDFTKLDGLEDSYLTQLEQQWEDEVGTPKSLELLFQDYSKQTKPFSEVCAEIVKTESAQEYAQKWFTDFANKVSEYVAGERPQVVRHRVSQLAWSYYFHHLCKAITNQSQSDVFHRSFEKNLKRHLTQIFSSYFPEESFHENGYEIFSEEPNMDKNFTSLQLEIRLVPVGRRMNGTPTVRAELSETYASSKQRTVYLPDPALPNKLQVPADGYGDLVATTMLRNAFSTRTAFADKPSKLSKNKRRRMVDELNDTVKEIMKGSAEDLSLELINQIIEGNGTTIVSQFENYIDTELDLLVFESFEHAAGLLEAGLSLLGGDD